MEKMFVYNNHIGSRRILKADEVAQNMEYQAVVLPGYADYLIVPLWQLSLPGHA